MKPYIFDETSCTTLDELGVAYSQNFTDALVDIYYNTKQLYKFIKKKNKALANEIIDLLAFSKYQNNALTFIIFKLCDDKRVVINGVTYNIKKIIATLKQKGKDSKAIYAFCEEKGLTKTFAITESEDKICKDLPIIEANLNEDYVFDYFVNYYNPKSAETFNSFIPTLFVNDEKFRRASETFKSDRFISILTNSLGLEKAYSVKKSLNPIFEVLPLIRKEYDISQLRRLIDDTFYWWLLDNYEAYDYQKESKDIKKKLDAILKRKNQNDKDFDFDKYVDIAQDLFTLYIDFANLYRDGKITLNKKTDSSFALDKPYCDTLIPVAYMKNNPVTLTNMEVFKKTDEEGNVVSEGEIEILTIDKTEEFNEQVKKQKKFHGKILRFRAWSIVIFIIMLLAITFGILDSKVEFIRNLVELPVYEYDMLYLIVAGGVGVLLIILEIVLATVIAKTSRRITYYNIIQKVKNGISVNENLIKVYNKIKDNEEKYKNSIFKTYKVLTMLILCLLSFIISFTAVLYIPVFWSLIGMVDKGFEPTWQLYVYLFASSGCAVIWGLIRKNKGSISILVFTILTIAGILGLSLVL